MLSYRHSEALWTGLQSVFDAKAWNICLHRDAIAEHNTARCYMAKGARLEQFPDVQPHPSVSTFSHMLGFHIACFCSTIGNLMQISSLLYVDFAIHCSCGE